MYIVYCIWHFTIIDVNSTISINSRQSANQSVKKIIWDSFDALDHCYWDYPNTFDTYVEGGVGVFKKIRTENPNRKSDIRTEFPGIRTEIFILFGYPTDNFIGLSVRIRIALFTQTGTR